MNPFDSCISRLGLTSESQGGCGHLYVLLRTMSAAYDGGAWTHTNAAREVMHRIGSDLLATIPGQAYAKRLVPLIDKLDRS